VFESSVLVEVNAGRITVVIDPSHLILIMWLRSVEINNTATNICYNTVANL
jgi:hypothetical protein